MRARRVGAGSEFRLVQDEKDIGRVDGSSVSFLGFATRDDAAQAASAAYHALARSRHAVEGRDEAWATLLPPAAEDSATGGWGFEIALLPSERVEVFALARARIMWRALQGTGMSRRMRQFADDLAPI